jgi:hypothetical protein
MKYNNKVRSFISARINTYNDVWEPLERGDELPAFSFDIHKIINNFK